MSMENNWQFDFTFRHDPRNEQLHAFVEKIIRGDLRFDDDPIPCEKLKDGTVRLYTRNNGYSTRFGFYNDFSEFLTLVSPLVVGAAHVRCAVDGDVEDIYLGTQTDVAVLKSQEALQICRKQIKLLTRKDLAMLLRLITDKKKDGTDLTRLSPAGDATPSRLGPNNQS